MPGLLRYGVTLAAAVGVTFALAWLMQFLISSELRWQEPEKGRVIEFVRLKRDSDLSLKNRQLPDLQQPEQAPPPPQLDFSKTDAPDQEVGGVMPIFDRDVDMIGGLNVGEAPSDTDIIPLVRVNPTYPQRAAARGIEGWVEVEFTITPSGTVANPVVIGSEPPKMFDTAALRAIRKWKYNPKIEDGKPVERTGVLVRLSFDLEDER